MASPQHDPATMEELPCDVLSNIFTRLLANQLAQMRCVSKSLNGFLSKSSFIQHHLRHSIHTNDKILLVFNDDGGSSDPCKMTAHRSQSPNLVLTNFIKFPVITESQLTSTAGISVVGSVHGLICYFYKSGHDLGVYIWNPSLSALLTLPPCSISSHGNSVSTYFGFGFDPKADDYSVVKLTKVYKQEWLQVEAYSMRKGYWELITQPFPSHIEIEKHSNLVCVDGCGGQVHWIGYINDEGKLPIIVAFDLSIQTFGEILLPDSIRYENMYCRTNYLGVMSGKLCLISRSKDLDCEIWVMDVYGVAESWVKHHVYSLDTAYISPYGFTSHGEFLFGAVEVWEDEDGDYDNEGYLALCYPIVAEPKTFRHIYSDPHRSFKIVEYVDSLVWVIPPTEPRTSCCSTSSVTTV